MTSPGEARREDPATIRMAEVRKGHERGWVFTPLSGKVPIREGWTKEPAPDLEQALEWARTHNVGLRTGQVSGVVIVDDDTEDGSGARELGLPQTVTAITGSGKRHHYFSNPPEPVRNSARKLAPGVDVRGEGGQVVFPGSVHPETGRLYRWAEGRSPDEIELAPFPTKLLKRLNSKKKGRGRLEKYAAVALERACDEVTKSTEGSRNDELNRQSFKVGRFVGADLLDEGAARERLVAAGRACGLEEREIEATVASGLGAGMDDPHDADALEEGLDSRRDTAATGTGDTETAGRPEILVEGGQLPEMVTQGEDALLQDGGPPLYRRGTTLVRIVRTTAPTLLEWFRRKQGALILHEVESPYLIERLTQAARWLKYDSRSKDYKDVDCPARVAKTYLARVGFWRLPVLTGIIEAPTLRPDGTVLATPGYDEATGLYFDPGNTAFEPVPDKPTKDQALTALNCLKWVLKDFPFVASSDRSAALAAFLTGLVRWMLHSAPLTAYRAPKMASGKSLLADVTAMIATGRPAAVMSPGQNEEENRKRITALLVEGTTVACIDNVEAPLGGASICSVLTQTMWKDRVLGETRTVTVPTACTWLATGNNLVFAGDLVTRVVVSDLDPACEHPEQRKFDVNLYDYVPKFRGDLVSAGLTVLRAYHVAGRPDQGLPVFGRFEEWSNLIRSALVWLGEADPCDGRKRLENVDPVRVRLEAILVAWQLDLGDSVVTAGEVVTRAQKAQDGPLAQALVGVAPLADLTGHRLGMWLDTVERRVEAGLRVERAGKRQGTTLWTVSRA